MDLPARADRIIGTQLHDVGTETQLSGVFLAYSGTFYCARAVARVPTVSDRAARPDCLSSELDDRIVRVGSGHLLPSGCGATLCRGHVPAGVCVRGLSWNDDRSVGTA